MFDTTSVATACPGFCHCHGAAADGAVLVVPYLILTNKRGGPMSVRAKPHRRPLTFSRVLTYFLLIAAAVFFLIPSICC
jgi:hypothetical protein